MDLVSGSFKIGRLFDIDIRIHFLFVVVMAFRLISAASDPHDSVVHQAYWWTMLFGIILCHEFGHCFGARHVHGDARVIVMWPLGGLAYAHAPRRPWPQFVTVAAGPLVNVLFCLLSGLLFVLHVGFFDFTWLNPLYGIDRFSLSNASSMFFWIGIFFNVNLFLLGFNLLPIFPMDGGQIFQTILWRWLGLQRATEIACHVGIAGAIILGVLGISGYGGGMLLFIAIFGGFTSFQQLKAARMGWLIEDDRFDYQYMNVAPKKENLFKRQWRKIFGQKRKNSTPSHNPNPGAWEAKREKEDKNDLEVDRILKKVQEHGLHSLTYIEQQKLKKATKKAQAEERNFEKHNRL